MGEPIRSRDRGNKRSRVRRIIKKTMPFAKDVTAIRLSLVKNRNREEIESISIDTVARLKRIIIKKREERE